MGLQSGSEIRREIDEIKDTALSFGRSCLIVASPVRKSDVGFRAIGYEYDLVIDDFMLAQTPIFTSQFRQKT